MKFQIFKIKKKKRKRQKEECKNTTERTIKSGQRSERKK